MANISENEVLSHKKLKASFDQFDLVRVYKKNYQDKNGKITADELATVLGRQYRNEFQEIIREIDQNGDGEVLL